MKAITDQSQQQVFAALDDLTAKLCAAIEAGSQAAKMLQMIWLESPDTDQTPHQRPTHNDRQSLVTTKELAELLRVSTRSIRKWKAKKGLPYRCVGADLRFDLAEVDEWTKRHRKNNHTLTAANGKVQPLQRRLQAKQGA